MGSSVPSVAMMHRTVPADDDSKAISLQSLLWWQLFLHSPPPPTKVAPGAAVPVSPCLGYDTGCCCCGHALVQEMYKRQGFFVISFTKQAG